MTIAQVLQCKKRKSSNQNTMQAHYTLHTNRAVFVRGFGGSTPFHEVADPPVISTKVFRGLTETSLDPNCFL